MSLDIAPLHWKITSAGRLEADGFGGVYAIDFDRGRVVLYAPKIRRPQPVPSVEIGKNAAQRHYESELKTRISYS